MAALHKIVIMGASGVLGSAILKVLQTKGFDITVLSRRGSQATLSGAAKVVKIPYDLSSLQQAFTGQDAVVCATHLSSMADQKTFIDACIAAGVHRYIINEFGNAPDFQGLPELEPTYNTKREILLYAQHQAAEHEAFTWTALATGHFLDYAIIKFAAFGFNLDDRSARLVDDGIEPFSATTLNDVGKAVAGILAHPAETSNRHLLVRSLETTQREILTAFEEQGGSTWKVEYVTAETLYEIGKAKLARGDRSGILALLPVQTFQKDAGRYAFPEDRYDNRLLNVEEQTVDQLVRDILVQTGGGIV